MGSHAHLAGPALGAGAPVDGVSARRGLCHCAPLQTEHGANCGAEQGDAFGSAQAAITLGTHLSDAEAEGRGRRNTKYAPFIAEVHHVQMKYTIYK